MIKFFESIKKFIFPCKENNYKPNILDGNYLVAFVLILIVFKLVSLLYFVIIPETPFFADVCRGSLVQLTNEERSNFGLKLLKENHQLNEAARLKAEDMVNNNYFSHWSPDGISPWYWFEKANYNYDHAGENLAAGFINARDVHREWINSTTHRDNILNPLYDEIGVAVVESEFYGQRTYLVVQMLGSRSSSELLSSLVSEEISLEEIEKIKCEIIDRYENIDELENETDQDNLFVSVLGDFDKGIYLSSSKNDCPEESSNFSFFQFMMTEYDDLIKKVSSFSIVFIGFVLIINVFIRFDVQRPDLIFKGGFFLLVIILIDFFSQLELLRMASSGIVIY